MVATVLTPISQDFPDAAAHDPVSTASSTHGIVTFLTEMRSISAPLPRMTSTTLLGARKLPHWAQSVLEDVRRFDRDFVLTSDTIQRLVQAVMLLPADMPKPEVGVGSDGTVGLEWDIDSTGVEIHLGNDPEDDAFILADDADIIEAPLFTTLPKVANVLGRIFSKRQG